MSVPSVTSSSAATAAAHSPVEAVLANIYTQLVARVADLNIVCSKTTQPVEFIVENARQKGVPEHGLKFFREGFQESFKAKIGHNTVVIIDGEQPGKVAAISSADHTTTESLKDAFNHDMIFGFDNAIQEIFARCNIELQDITYTTSEKTVTVKYTPTHCAIHAIDLPGDRNANPGANLMKSFVLAQEVPPVEAKIELADAVTGKPRFIDDDSSLHVQALVRELNPTLPDGVIQSLPAKYYSSFAYSA